MIGTASLVVLGALVLAVAVLAGATAMLGAANRELRDSGARWQGAVSVLHATCARLRAVRVSGQVQQPDGCWCLASGETIGDVVARFETPGPVPRQSRGDEWRDPWTTGVGTSAR